MDFMNEFLLKGFYIKPRGTDQAPLAHDTPCPREMYDFLLRLVSRKDRRVGEKPIRRGRC